MREEILNHIALVMGNMSKSDCLEEYHKWRENCLITIAEQRQINEVLSVGVKLLNNPVALFDSSINLIAYAGEFNEPTDGTIWEMILQYGYSKPEVFPKVEQKIISDWILSDTKTLHFDSALDPAHDHMTTKCFKGMLSMIDLNKRFTPGEEALLEELASFAELSLKTTEISGRSTSNIYYINRLLEGMNVDSAVLAQSLKPLRWSTEGEYLLAILKSSHKNDYVINSFIQRLKRSVSGTIVQNHEANTIVISDKPEKLKHYLQVEIPKFEIVASVSPIFFHLDKLYPSYIQAKISFSFSEPGKVISFEDVYTDYLLETISKHTEPSALCCPKLLELKEEGSPHNLDLIENLRVLLLSGGDIAETARKLHLHRNTLIYRIEKLQSLLGYDLKLLDESRYFYLLMSCMLLSQEPSHRSQ